MSELGGCLGFAAAIFGVTYLLTNPDGDQVCRQRKVWIMDSIHGIEWQPTCNDLIRQIERRAIDAERKADGLEERMSEVESRLNI